MQSQKIILSDNLFLGKGAHKICYQHPTDNNLCIKILFQTPDVDLEKELKYREILKRQNKESQLIPKYLGTIDTNFGEGHVYECCRDYNGQISLTIKEFISNKPSTPEHISDIIDIILKFKEIYFKEKIITSDMDPANFMIQRYSKDQFTIKIIDNIGTPVLIPLAYYIDFFAAKRAKKYWRRFIDYLVRFFPNVFTQDVIKNIQ